jgi:hypothetical protein
MGSRAARSAHDVHARNQLCEGEAGADGEGLGRGERACWGASNGPRCGQLS